MRITSKKLRSIIRSVLKEASDLDGPGPWKDGGVSYKVADKRGKWHTTRSSLDAANAAYEEEENAAQKEKILADIPERLRSGGSHNKDPRSFFILMDEKLLGGVGGIITNNKKNISKDLPAANRSDSSISNHISNSYSSEQPANLAQDIYKSASSGFGRVTGEVIARRIFIVLTRHKLIRLIDGMDPEDFYLTIKGEANKDALSLEKLFNKYLSVIPEHLLPEIGIRVQQDNGFDGKPNKYNGMCIGIVDFLQDRYYIMRNESRRRKGRRIK